jgi:hypothetical protein
LSVPSAPLFLPQPGEDAGRRFARIVRLYDKCSLHNRRADLASLVCRGTDDESIVEWKTNCAVFILGVLAAAGCPHPALKQPLKNGMAFSVMIQIGNDYGAWRDPAKDGQPKAVCVLWYERIAGDDHAEVFLSEPDEHGGGGRADNAITVGHSDIHESWGRPVHRWLDLGACRLPDAHVEEVDKVISTGQS